MAKKKDLQDIVKDVKIKKKKRDEVMEKVATELGFKDDKYYTAGEKMVEEENETEPSSSTNGPV